MKQNKAKTPNPPVSKQRKDSDKLSPSTASPQSPANLSQNPFKSCEDLWSADTQQSFERLASSLCSIQGSQQEMKARFDRMVQYLTAQIARNTQENRKLAQEVVQLTKEVRQTGEDIKLIEGMLRSGRNEKERSRGPSQEKSVDRNQSRISNSSASRRLLLSSRSNQRQQLAKRHSGRLFMSFGRV